MEAAEDARVCGPARLFGEECDRSHGEGCTGGRVGKPKKGTDSHEAEGEARHEPRHQPTTGELAAGSIASKSSPTKRSSAAQSVYSWSCEVSVEVPSLFAMSFMMNRTSRPYCV